MLYSCCRTRRFEYATLAPRPASRAARTAGAGTWTTRSILSEGPGMTHLTWLEAAVVGVVQGVSELFPVSSLGHSVLLPAVIGGSWARDLDVSAQESPYLAFIVGTHVATALALVFFYRRDWVRLIRALPGTAR